MKKLLFMFIYVFTIVNAFGQDISYNETFQINSSNIEYTLSPSMDVLKNGNYIVCWEQESNLFYESVTEIYATILDKDGKVIVNEFQVNSYMNDHQGDPYLCVLKDGKIVIVWKTDMKGDSSYEISAQFISESGEKVGDEFRVNTFSNSSQWKPCVASLTNGGFVVVWESWHQDGSDVGIFAQIFDSDGNKMGSEFQVNTLTDGWQCEPTVIGLSNGEFLINYKSDLDQPGYYADFIQRFDENGLRIGDEMLLGNYPDFDSGRKADLCELPDDKFAVIRLTNESLIVRIFNENGQIENINEIELFERRYKSQSIGNINNENIIVFLTSYDMYWGDSKIQTQLFDLAGNKVGNLFDLTDKVANVYFSPIAKAVADDKFVVIWNGWENDKGIYGKYYLSEPLNHELTNFEVLNPSDDKTIYDRKITFDWDIASNIHINFPWELTYDLYIDTDDSFSESIHLEDIQDTTYQIDSLSSGKTYFWKVLARNILGDSLWSSNVNGFYVDPNATDIIEIESTMPEKFELFQNYPNPFNPTTNITYSLPVGQTNYHVVIKIYDVLGRLVTELVNTNQQPGNYQIEFSANELTSGIYFYFIQASEFYETKKMLLMR